MSDYRYKRRRSRSRSYSRSSANKRESQQNRNKHRSVDYERHHHHLTPSNRQDNSHQILDSNVSINEIINHPAKYPPIVQSFVQEFLVEQKKRLITEERLNICERDNVLLRDKYEQAINSLTLLKYDFDKCRVDLKTSLNELNELRHTNYQLRLHLDHQLNNERQQIYPDDTMFYSKRQGKY